LAWFVRPSKRELLPFRAGGSGVCQLQSWCLVMSDLKAKARARVEPRRAAAAKTKTEMGQCLVVSACQANREALSQAANRGGWDTIVCADDRNALSALGRTRFQLAIVDLNVIGATPAGFRELSQTLATQSGLLLVVCGKESDPQEEIWARQLGVWLYLPGVTPEHRDEIALICEQAQTSVELSAARESSKVTATKPKAKPLGSGKRTRK
jgi:DNA-binding NtrC family response regulator